MVSQTGGVLVCHPAGDNTMSSVTFDPSGSSVQQQMQVSILRKTQEQQAQSAVQLIQAVEGVSDAPQTANQPYEGQNIDVRV
jgi:hypothetical protein